MGQEIGKERFSQHDFALFGERLRAETALLRHCFDTDALSHRHGIGGYELEAWLIDGNGRPAPINEAFLVGLDDAMVSPELSRFNVELNSSPRPVGGDFLRRMHDELLCNWERCRAAARPLAAELVMIGILPTVTESDLTLAQMSRLKRYQALNDQVLQMRQGRPLELDIQGEEHLRTCHGDVMLEAATTSLQLHLQVALPKAVRYYNAAQILSAPVVAMSANSPLLFGKRLWQETRIPLFEQAVAVGGIADAAAGPLRRVSFGSGYARHSLFELFRENLEHFPIMLPMRFDSPPTELSHLRLHNGTIWRWNRPLVGFDADGTPHLRLEHRVMAAGPSPVDSVANAALFFGLLHMLGEADVPPERRLDFAQARDNFYAAARFGLAAQVGWFDGVRCNVAELLQQHLLPLAREGLRRLGCDEEDIRDYLDVIGERVRTGRTGAQWQLSVAERSGGDLAALVLRYLSQQNSGLPVHEWPQ